MLEHLNKNYEDFFFHMMDEEIQDNFELNPFKRVFNKSFVLFVHDKGYRLLDNRKIENTQNCSIDSWRFNQDIIDRQLEFSKTSTNFKLYEYENVKYEYISKNHKEFEFEEPLSVNSEVVKEESSNILRLL